VPQTLPDSRRKNPRSVRPSCSGGKGALRGVGLLAWSITPYSAHSLISMALITTPARRERAGLHAKNYVPFGGKADMNRTLRPCPLMAAKRKGGPAVYYCREADVGDVR